MTWSDFQIRFEAVLCNQGAFRKNKFTTKRVAAMSKEHYDANIEKLGDNPKYWFYNDLLHEKQSNPRTWEGSGYC